MPPTKTQNPKIDIETRDFHLSLSKRTYVMGVLNVTPDSFSENGEFFNRDRAVSHALDMANDGADIIDIGGESTRPGAAEVSLEEELDRVIPVVEGISRSIDIPLSIDTRKAKVAEEGLKRGAGMVNDISGLRHDPEMAPVVARYEAALIVMHMRLTPRDMQINPIYKDLIGEITAALRESIDIAKRSGVDEDRIIIDPGIGFGKTVEHNLQILNRLAEFKALGRPVCVGTSRKSFIGRILGLEDPRARIAGTLASCAVAVMNGANLLRVHDVKETVETARMADSIAREKAL